MELRLPSLPLHVGGVLRDGGINQLVSHRVEDRVEIGGRVDCMVLLEVQVKLVLRLILQVLRMMSSEQGLF